MFIVILCVLSILWIPLVKASQSGQLFVYIQSVQGYLGTPIGALFVLAILWGRMNEQVSTIEFEKYFIESDFTGCYKYNTCNSDWRLSCKLTQTVICCILSVKF